MKFRLSKKIPLPGTPASGPASSSLGRVVESGGDQNDSDNSVTPVAPQIRNPQSAIRNPLAFTLIELLVVIVIIGILASMGMLAIRGMTKSNAIVAADRQLLDDLSYARRLAIANHTTVYMLFIPPNIVDTTAFPIPANTNVAAMIANLYQGQFTTYALFAYRSVGDQPGQTSARYLTSWKTLPNSVYIATNKFYSVPGLAPTFNYNMQFPFPVENNLPSGPGQFYLPYVAFNYLGQLVYTTNGQDVLVAQSGQQAEYIPLAHGSIFYSRDANGNLIPGPVDLQETPPGQAYYQSYASTNARAGANLPGAEAGLMYNQIYIDPLTGKARVERLEVQ